MNNKKKRIIVKGALGFIGSNLTDSLLEQGAEVVGIGNLFNWKMENLEEALKHNKFEFYFINIKDVIQTYLLGVIFK